MHHHHTCRTMLLLAILLPAAHAGTTVTPSATPVTPTTGVMAKPCQAMTPMPAPIVKYMHEVAAAKAAGQPPPQPSPEQMAKGLRLYHAWEQTRLLEDFAGHCHYASADAALPPAQGRRVVLFGDSITELWKDRMPKRFGTTVLDRGVSGQTTAQMLVRFRQDVLDLHPDTVQIMAGTNDLAGNTGPTKLAWIEQNIRSMVELAQAHGIRVLLASVPPARAFDWRPGIDPRPAIAKLNHWLRDYATAHCLGYVDYHPVLAAADGGMRAAYTSDGVHPNQAGYEVMWPVLQQALAQPPATCHRPAGGHRTVATGRPTASPGHVPAGAKAVQDPGSRKKVR